MGRRALDRGLAMQLCSFLADGTAGAQRAGLRPAVSGLFLHDGDIAEVEIERLGCLRNPVIAGPGVAGAQVVGAQVAGAGAEQSGSSS